MVSRLIRRVRLSLGLVTLLVTASHAEAPDIEMSMCFGRIFSARLECVDDFNRFRGMPVEGSVAQMA